VYGVKEVVQGAGNTPTAIKASNEDLEWDHEKKAYAPYNLDEEAEAVLHVDMEAKFPKKVSLWRWWCG
jgi:hypothetical protein